MVTCPKCKAMIDSLMYYSNVEVTQTFCIDEDACPDYSEMDDYGDHSDERYVCPMCDKVLATNEEGAIKILREEK